MVSGSIAKLCHLFSGRLSKEIYEDCSLAVDWVLVCRSRKRLSNCMTELSLPKAPGQAAALCLLSSSIRSYHFPMLKFRQHSLDGCGVSRTVCSWLKTMNRRWLCLPDFFVIRGTR